MPAMIFARPIKEFESSFECVNGIRLHYWIGGDPNGQPVVLWHGFPSAGYSWRKVAPALADAGLSVLVPDMRGYGDSDKPGGTAGYDVRALAEEARALVAALDFGKRLPIIHAAQDMGALGALIWAADHPEEVKGLVYIEAPVMAEEVLGKVIANLPNAATEGSMWWWILPLAPGLPERLIVGNERAFLTWLYEKATARPETIEADAVDEYLRTFCGKEGVLGTLGIFRAAAASIAQTEPLMKSKVSVPITAIGGEKGLGRLVGEMVGMVAENVTAHTLSNCGHFISEECPDAVIKHVLAIASR